MIKPLHSHEFKQVHDGKYLMAADFDELLAAWRARARARRGGGAARDDPRPRRPPLQLLHLPRRGRSAAVPLHQARHPPLPGARGLRLLPRHRLEPGGARPRPAPLPARRPARGRQRGVQARPARRPAQGHRVQRALHRRQRPGRGERLRPRASSSTTVSPACRSRRWASRPYRTGLRLWYPLDDFLAYLELRRQGQPRASASGCAASRTARCCRTSRSADPKPSLVRLQAQDADAGGGQRAPHRRAVDGRWHRNGRHPLPGRDGQRRRQGARGRRLGGGQLPRGPQPADRRRRARRRGSRRRPRSRRPSRPPTSWSRWCRRRRRRDGRGVRRRGGRDGPAAALPGRQLGLAGDRGRGGAAVEGAGCDCVDGAFVGSAKALGQRTTPVPERRRAEELAALLGDALDVRRARPRGGRRLGVQARLRRLQQGPRGAVPRGDGRGRPPGAGRRAAASACARSTRARSRRVERLLPSYPRHAARRADGDGRARRRGLRAQGSRRPHGRGRRGGAGALRRPAVSTPTPPGIWTLSLDACSRSRLPGWRRTDTWGTCTW